MNFTRQIFLRVALAAVMLSAKLVLAIDPPHVTANACGDCHFAHQTAGTDLTSVAGNGNLCMSCHTPGGSATAKAFVSADQALPWPGLPAGTNATGTSHRWDANAAGHLVYLGGAAKPSTGTIFPSGVYTGAYAKTYTLQITTAGVVGAAQFGWTATMPGGVSGANLATGTNVPLDAGVLVSFVNGTNVSFQTGDRWNLLVRNDLRNPTNAIMQSHMVNGMATCSACHNEHSQQLPPFDPNAAAYSVGGTTNSVVITWTAVSNLTYRAQYNSNLATTNWVDLLPNVTATSAVASVVDHPLPSATQRFYRVLVVSAATNRPYISSLKWSASTNAIALRHFMRVTNNFNQMCNDCHASRAVTNAAAGSHPVEINAIADATHRLPTQLPLEAGLANLGCLTCHQIHHGPDGDGKLLRLTNSVALCNDCHAQSDTTTPAAHFSRTNSATLWPGGKYGSLMPARTDTNDNGTCLNCHPTHGWPDTANPTNHYAHLLADFQENFCFTCHGTNGPAAKLVGNSFTNRIHHPVVNSDPLRQAGRSVECVDCHNSHQALPGSHVYTNTATAFRNAITNAPSLRGVDGVAFSYSGLTNFQTVATNRFTYLSKTAGATNEYQICLKCHSGYSWGTNTPPGGITTNGTVASPVETDLAQEFSPMNKSGHPVMTGLNNYSNSVAPKALAAAALKAPWNVNIGTQTMMCSDCHDATTTNYVASAAQGPHGSAFNFMLRGPNGNNWPNVTSFATSWCANCHNDTVSMDGHANHHSAGGCNACHIVIPHGGKMSRLIADGDGTMPARYALNSAAPNTTVKITSFTKATGSYSEGNCQTSCGRHSSGSSTTMENW